MSLPCWPDFRMVEAVDAEGVLRLTLLGELDIAVVDQLTLQLEQLRLDGEKVRVDLSRLEFIDARGFAALMCSVSAGRSEGATSSRSIRTSATQSGASLTSWVRAPCSGRAARRELTLGSLASRIRSANDPPNAPLRRARRLSPHHPAPRTHCQPSSAPRHGPRPLGPSEPPRHQPSSPTHHLPNLPPISRPSRHRQTSDRGTARGRPSRQYERHAVLPQHRDASAS